MCLNKYNTYFEQCWGLLYFWIHVIKRHRKCRSIGSQWDDSDLKHSNQIIQNNTGLSCLENTVVLALGKLVCHLIVRCVGFNYQVANHPHASPLDKFAVLHDIFLMWFINCFEILSCTERQPLKYITYLIVSTGLCIFVF